MSHLKRKYLVHLREDKFEEDKEEYYIVDGGDADISHIEPPLTEALVGFLSVSSCTKPWA